MIWDPFDTWRGKTLVHACLYMLTRVSMCKYHRTMLYKGTKRGEKGPKGSRYPK